ncbi:hypothetical protein I552_1133 [Mycobacterium xenopi 3993]|nr:hypothetical protein I552_1133 [Mycobacterium xenopi 3993]
MQPMTVRCAVCGGYPAESGRWRPGRRRIGGRGAGRLRVG